MNWLLNLRWLLPSAAGFIVLVAWQRYYTAHLNEWNAADGSTRLQEPPRDPVTDNSVDMAHAFTVSAGGRRSTLNPMLRVPRFNKTRQDTCIRKAIAAAANRHPNCLVFVGGRNESRPKQS